MVTIVAPMDEILERAHVVALPMRVKFRGITVREAVLFDGPKGWGSSRRLWNTVCRKRRSGCGAVWRWRFKGRLR